MGYAQGKLTILHCHGDLQVIWDTDIELNSTCRVFGSYIEYQVCNICVVRHLVLFRGIILPDDLHHSSLKLFCIMAGSRTIPTLSFCHIS